MQHLKLKQNKKVNKNSFLPLQVAASTTFETIIFHYTRKFEMFVKAYHVCGHGIFIGQNGISLTFGLKDKVWSKAQIIFWLALQAWRFLIRSYCLATWS
jgi:hypothetical protein